MPARPGGRILSASEQAPPAHEATPGEAAAERRLGDVVAALGASAEERPGQLEMAAAVARALEGDGHLVCRAGTGVGKSLAYLVPAALSKKRVLIATATRALQDQLADKDLPLVCAGLAEPPSFAVLKGRSNYLCRQRLRESAIAGTQQRLGAPARASRTEQEARAIAAWAETTATGDRAELDFEPSERVWSAFSVSADECPGAHRCPSGEDCFAEAARDAARAADICVVNLHLLGADLSRGRAVLPEFDALVVDEAHELESVLSQSLGRSISAGRLRAVQGSARAAGRTTALTAAADELGDVATRLEEVLAALGEQRLRSGIPEDLAAVLALASTRLGRVESALGATGGDGDDATARLRAQLLASSLREEIDALSSLGDESVAWISGGPRPSLEVAPLDLAPIFAAAFGELPVVLTSATVPANLGVRLGLGDVDSLEVQSPFDYENQALLYCAAHLPERRSAGFDAAMVDELVALIEAAGGRTLALFTSRAAMERAAAAVRERVGVPVLVQDELTRSESLAQFAADEATCLFATMAFWQGIDVPGASLSLVVIDRLPFPRPDEPLAAARREAAGPAGFRTVDLVRAAGLLAQGAGRLIRSRTDRGVVAVLDGRLATASYRWELIRALPPMRRTRERGEALAFLAELAAEHSG